VVILVRVRGVLQYSDQYVRCEGMRTPAPCMYTIYTCYTVCSKYLGALAAGCAAVSSRPERMDDIMQQISCYGGFINRNAGRRTSCAGAHQSRGGDHSSKHSSTPKLVNTTAVACTRSTTVRRAPTPRLSVLGIHREQSARFLHLSLKIYSKQAMTGRSVRGM
jgi:hypothetical protein